LLLRAVLDTKRPADQAYWRNAMDTENDKDGELMNLRALARAVVLKRQPVQYVVYQGEDGEPIYDPFVRYGPNVVVVPKKLTNEEWQAKYAHLAEESKTKRAGAPTARTASLPPTASAPGEREEATASPGPEKAQGSAGVRRRSRFRP
jgi:hypothetical protein